MHGVTRSTTTADSAAAGGEFLVNTTTQGDQLYPTVAESHLGAFAIAWNGNGTQTGQQDSSGVFIQQYLANGAANGGETRVNVSTGGVRQYASIGMDAAGNYVVAWTGPSASVSGNTDVFTSPSAAVQPVTVLDGPIVCYVTLPNMTQPLYGQTADTSGQIVDDSQEGTRLIPASVVQPPASGVQALTFFFDVDMFDGRWNDRRQQHPQSGQLDAHVQQHGSPGRYLANRL